MNWCARRTRTPPPGFVVRHIVQFATCALVRKMVETVGNAPTATILQGSSAPLCCPRGAEGWFRANLPASSARRFHQISFLGVRAFAPVLSIKLVRASVIETESPEWRSGASGLHRLKRAVAILREH